MEDTKKDVLQQRGHGWSKSLVQSHIPQATGEPDSGILPFPPDPCSLPLHDPSCHPLATFHLTDFQGALPIRLSSLLWPSPFQSLFVLSDSMSTLYLCYSLTRHPSCQTAGMGADSFEACLLHGTALCAITLNSSVSQLLSLLFAPSNPGLQILFPFASSCKPLALACDQTTSSSISLGGI